MDFDDVVKQAYADTVGVDVEHVLDARLDDHIEDNWWDTFGTYERTYHGIVGTYRVPEVLYKSGPKKGQVKMPSSIQARNVEFSYHDMLKLLVTASQK